MTCRSNTAQSNPGQHGFTLLEMVAVLAVAGLMLGLAVSSGRPVSASTHARLAAGEIASALRSARAQAIAADRPVAVAFDLAGHRYRIGEEEWRAVAPVVTMVLLTTAPQASSSSSGRIRFTPDGSASGGRITLQGGGRRIRIGVDWLTGRVSEDNG